MPQLPSRFDLPHYFNAIPQIQQDFTSSTARTEAKRGIILHEVVATPNGLATSIILGIKPSNISKWVRRHQETGGVAKMQRAGQLALLLDTATKEAVRVLLDIRHEGT